MKAEPIQLRITGSKRLIMHCGRLADPLDPITKDLFRLTSKRFKTEADHEEISRVEWFGSLWLHEGEPCIPAEALTATFVEAAKSRKRGPQAKAGLVVEQHARLKFRGPTDVDELWKDARFRLRVGVNVKGSRTMRTRPVFSDWSVDFTAHFLPTLLDRDEVVETYAVAGFLKGLGDWRPQNGTYSVKVIEKQSSHGQGVARRGIARSGVARQGGESSKEDSPNLEASHSSSPSASENNIISQQP